MIWEPLIGVVSVFPAQAEPPKEKVLVSGQGIWFCGMKMVTVWLLASLPVSVSSLWWGILQLAGLLGPSFLNSQEAGLLFVSPSNRTLTLSQSGLSGSSKSPRFL